MDLIAGKKTPSSSPSFKECSFLMKYEIREERLKKCQPDQRFDSKFTPSNIPGISYKLIFTPNGSSKTSVAKPSETLIFLYLTIPEYSKVYAKFSIAIKNSSMIEAFETVFLRPQGRGKVFTCFEDLINPMKREIAGSMIIEVKGIFKIDRGYPVARGPSAVSSFLWERKDKDFVLEADGKQIKAHKWILQANSDVFNAMIEKAWKESQENEVKIEGFSFKTLETVIEFCYEQNIEKGLDIDDALELLRFADMYHMKGLQARIERFLCNKISDSNVYYLANASVTPSLVNVSNEVYEHCISYLLQLSKTDSLDLKGLDAAVRKEICNRFFSPNFCCL